MKDKTPKLAVFNSSTDHFEFHCAECRSELRVIKIAKPRSVCLDDETWDEVASFVFYCPNCDTRFQRKTYFNNPRPINNGHEGVHGRFPFVCRAARELGLNRSSLYMILDGRRKDTRGLVDAYKKIAARCQNLKRLSA